MLRFRQHPKMAAVIMWPEPGDPAITHRMRNAHRHARRALGAEPAADTWDAWGWHGRTLGQPVTTGQRAGWLRLASAPTGRVATLFWNGAIDADRALPPSVQRPRLLCWHDWTDEKWTYRAELYEHTQIPTISPYPTLAAVPTLPDSWWNALRVTLHTLATVPTGRVTADPGFLTWALPHYLGDIDLVPDLPWTTAHGDLHFANLCAPLCVLDWEGWGKAPAGYDAAVLHSHSLLVPSAAAKIRHELAEHLNTPEGQFAELAVIVELLHAATHDGQTKLTEPLRTRAETLLRRPIPRPS